MAGIYLLALLSSCSFIATGIDLRVDEPAVRVILKDNRSAVSLALENTAPNATPTDVRLEWVNEKDGVDAVTERTLSVPPGKSEVVIPFPLVSNPKVEPMWYRLRYRIRAQGGETSGTLSLAHHAAHVFQLRAVLPDRARSRDVVRMLVTAVHPVSGKPVAGVAISATVNPDEKPPLAAQAITDKDGLASLEFRPPDEPGVSRLEFAVRGRLGDFEQSADLSLEVDRSIQVSVQTDKPIYQPGQTLHVRLLCFDAARRAAASRSISLRVEDPDNTGVFITRLVTNPFGVAAVDWQIPANSRLGDYVIRIQSGDEDYSDGFSAEQQIKISRYELPDFRVTAKPDQPYYLPGQVPAVEILAEYLFGKPVVNAPAWVVRENSREWNYKLQKWDIEEGEKYEGQTNATGRFTARLDLKEAHGDVAGDARSRYKDVSFTAYVRDPSSGRTEQRRFDLRMTKEAIHIYLIQSRSGDLYVSTIHADGSPVSASLSVNGIVAAGTNRYGVARIVVPEGADEIRIAADDGHGAQGRHREIIDGSRDAFRVRTDRNIYRPGEPIRVEVTSSEPASVSVLQVLREGTLLHSEWLDLSNQRATAVIPWREDFVHEITIGVVGTDSYQKGSRTVLYPADRGLKLNVLMGQSSYRPGTEANAKLEAWLPDGSAAAGALGVSIVDAAVGERARTDAESAGASIPAWQWRSSRIGRFNRVSRHELYRLDCSKPIPADLDLVAEVMLAFDYYWPQVDKSVDYEDDLAGSFNELFEAQLKSSAEALEARYKNDFHYSRAVEGLRSDLRQAGVNLDSLRDPWDMRFRIRFDTHGTREGFTFFSAGPDKTFDTDDDLNAKTIDWPYFAATRAGIELIIRALPEFPQSKQEVRQALLAEHLDLDRLPDPWGMFYQVRFEILKSLAVLSFYSAGPDRVFGTTDDIWVERITGEYFIARHLKLDAMIHAAGAFPENEKDWNRLLRIAGQRIEDPWGRPPYLTFNRLARYIDLAKSLPVSKSGGTTQMRTQITPATEQLKVIHLRSIGPDGFEGTSDDFDLASFSQTSAATRKQVAAMTRNVYSGSKTRGAISGTVTDSSGAVIPGADIRAFPDTSVSRYEQYEGRTGPEGRFILDLLPPGTYDLRIRRSAFKMAIIRNVLVVGGRVTIVDVRLEVAGVNETVTVQGSFGDLQTQTSMGYLVSKPHIIPGAQSTPRLREYFPETLLWLPLLETDRDGHAELKFRLADNITTWKLDVIGSTQDGEIGTATAEIKAFQPFFLDLNPPRVLTQGDEIELPVTMRNYLDQAQNVTVSMQPENWLRLLGAGEQKALVAGGASANVVFPVKAVAAVSEGKQRVTGTSPAAGDAVEKPVTVHPDGKEIAETVNRVFSGDTTLELAVPANAIQGSMRAELRIYPNLLAHVLDSIEGVLHRPYGCAEQAISTAYPNLLLLRYLRQTARPDRPLQARARGNLQRGVDLLLGYQAPDGGFSYWGRGAADLSLTAYAISFLKGAKEFAVFDEEVLKSAQNWLVEQQDVNGSWPAYDWKKQHDGRRTVYQTAFIAMALAGEGSPVELSKAIGFLQQQSGRFDEPYAVAALAISANKEGKREVSAQALQRLRSLARTEAGMTYWNLETNTPFYGWGLAGRLETSALVVHALAAGGNPADKPLIESAMLFLLRNKDRYGVWHSTQATVRVLEAILAAAPQAPMGGSGARVEILVDDQAVTQFALPAENELSGPIRVDLSQSLTAGRHRVSLRSPGFAIQAQAQLAMSYYLPWQASPPAGPGPLRLKVSFDKPNARVGEPVTCRVEVERAGFRGYGMMVAEIGLPPGADVDRQSLDNAVQATAWALSHYDVLPDRIVAYLWPRAGGTGFSFRFRPRFAMRAKSAPSLLYDYYNPDARVLLFPALFRVAGAPGSALAVSGFGPRIDILPAIR